MTELKSLSLFGDGDDVDIVYSVESAFDINITNEQVEQLENFGDLYDLIVRELGKSTSPKACFSSHVFYQLRSSLSQAGYQGVRPNTSLTSLTHPNDAGTLWRNLEDDTRLDMPALASGLAFWFSNLSAFLGLSIMVFGSFWDGLVVFAIASAATLYFEWVDSSHLPFGRDGTIRDLTTRVVRENFGTLAKRLGGFREEDAWQTLTEVVVEASERIVDPKSIDRGTVFFDSMIPKTP